MERPLRHTFSYGKFIELAFGCARHVISDASGIVCVGEKEADFLRERWPNNGFCAWPTALILSDFPLPSRPYARKAFNIRPYRTLLLCVSRIDEQKNQKAARALHLDSHGRGRERTCAHHRSAKHPILSARTHGTGAGAAGCRTGSRSFPTRADDERLVAAYQDAISSSCRRKTRRSASSCSKHGARGCRCWPPPSADSAARPGRAKTACSSSRTTLSSLLNAYRTLSRYGLRSNHNQRPTRSLDPLQLRCHEQPARRVLPREHRRTEQLNVKGTLSVFPRRGERPNSRLSRIDRRQKFALLNRHVKPVIHHPGAGGIPRRSRCGTPPGSAHPRAFRSGRSSPECPRFDRRE